jgi:plastocyanin
MEKPGRSVFVFLVIAVAVFVLAGCGDDDGGSSATNTNTTTTDTTATQPSGGGEGGAAKTTLKIAADPSGAFKFDKSSLESDAGDVTIVMDNPSPIDHAVSIEGNGVDEDGNTVGKGGVSRVTAKLSPGTYKFYCPVDGHEAGGMKGELTVK